VSLSISKAKPINALIILDGWGLAPVWGGNAVALARSRNFVEITKKYPYTSLIASDGAVGLPPGSPGNSESGHLNIGAGRVVLQDQVNIDRQIESGAFFGNKILLDAIEHARKNQSAIHLMGLLSKNGTHSHTGHLFALLDLLERENFKNVFIHLFTDGRDSETMSGIELLAEVEGEIKKRGIGQIASIIGRFYAMDRDNNWQRIKAAYELLTEAKGKRYASAGQVFANSYSSGITDEFIGPSIIADKDKTLGTIEDNDSVIVFNFRADRAREISSAFFPEDISDIANRKIRRNLFFASFVLYGNNPNVLQVFRPGMISDTISKIWSDHGLSQFHIAETEKYAHVTYFINGGKSQPHPGEKWQLIPSPKVRTYDLKPTMSAKEVTDTAISEIKKNIHDCLIINYANPDMVGHTGNLKATIEAVEFVDTCLGRLLSPILESGGNAFVMADHGNAEQMVNPRTTDPDTEHTMNPVPFGIVTKNEELLKLKLKEGQALASVAPTVLEIMKLSFERDQKANSLILK